MSGRDSVLVWSPGLNGHGALMLSLLEASDILHDMSFPWELHAAASPEPQDAYSGAELWT